MSKKNNTTIIEEAMNTAQSVEKLLTENQNVSLRKLSIATDTTYTLLLKASKEPQVGCAYDPQALNYEKIASFFNRRKIKLDDLDWVTLNDHVTVRASTVCKDITKFEVGSLVYLRKYPDVPYHIVYKTETHVVILLDGTTEPQSWSWNTFLLNGPQFTPRSAKLTMERRAKLSLLKDSNTQGL